MYAIIKDGAHQYNVTEGEILDIHYRKACKAGDNLEFQVAVLNTGKEVKVGTPFVSGAKVVAKVLEHVKGDKLVAFKKHRRKGYVRKIGHRQKFTQVKIAKIHG